MTTIIIFSAKPPDPFMGDATEASRPPNGPNEPHYPLTGDKELLDLNKNGTKVDMREFVTQREPHEQLNIFVQ